MNTKITSVEAAFAAKGLDINLLPDVSVIPERYAKRVIANFKMDVVIDALNDEDQEEPWNADFSNYDQDKFEPWFVFSPGVGWSLDDVVHWNTHSLAGARRNFRTRKIAAYAATHPEFLALYNEIL